MNTELERKKILPLLIKFSIPSTIAVLINIIYNITDRYFIGQNVGRDGIGALAIIFPVTIIIGGIGMFFAIGGASAAGIKLGEKDKVGAEKVLGTTIFWIIIIGLSLTGLILLNLTSILEMLGASKNNIGYAYTYYAYIIPTLVLQLVFMSLNAFIRTEGNPMLSMKINLFGAVLNTILDYILIVRFGMGIKGAAIGTAIAGVVPAIIQLHHFFRSDIITLKLKNIRPNLEVMMGISKIGIGSFLNQFLNGISVYIMNIKLNYYGGDLAIAAVGIVATSRNFINTSFIGFNQGRQPILSYNYGAKKFDRVKETFILSTKITFTIALILVFIVVGNSDTIARFFVNDEKLIEFTGHAIRLNLFMMVSTALYLSGTNYFQSVGKGKKTTQLLTIRLVVLTIPLIYILPIFWGLNGVWLAFPISDTIAAVVAMYFMKEEFKEMKSKPLVQSTLL
ncbi:MATE family efflux transporter [Psychrilyobacter sp.]|uniref:MATE family efflux transporter n=1 Tax=Psychrilyobacter sp. TaxID=2586924 RepID=UPI0030175625